LRWSTLERIRYKTSEHLALPQTCCPHKNKLRSAAVNTAYPSFDQSKPSQCGLIAVPFTEKAHIESPGFLQLVVKTQSSTHVVSVSDSGIYSLVIHSTNGLVVKNMSI